MGRTLAQRVKDEIAASGMIPPEAAVLALVSGGADSMCLLDVLARVHPGRLGVATFDHGLRPGAAQECALVERESRRRGLAVWTERLDVSPGPSVQARARTARRAAADAIALREGFDLIATGHTASDQVETVLFRLARGTGRTGAMGMRARSGRVVRPLLTVDRDETREWCRSNGLPSVDDPSNGDPRFARTRVREHLVPAFADVHPGAIRALGRFAAQLADEDAILTPLVDAARDRCARGDALDAAALSAEPAPLARIVVREWLVGHGIAADERWVRTALAVAATGGRCDMPGGGVAVDRGHLAVRPSAVADPDPVDLSVPGEVSFGSARIRAWIGVATAPGPGAISLPPDARLLVRAPAPGDRLALHDGGHARVGRMLRDLGVPASERGRIPIVVDRGRVVWVAGYRASPRALAVPGDNAIRLELV